MTDCLEGASDEKEGYQAISPFGERKRKKFF